MGGDDSNTNVMSSVLLLNNSLSCEPLWVSASSASLHGGKTMVNFEDVGGEDSMETPFLHSHVKEEITGDEDYDLCLSQPGKKRRLSATQVQFLERNFEVENKLEPERKTQLAKELGLQPRQVAIWFQNRRARFKNKQLEKDYDSLKASFDKLKSDYDILLKERESLKNEVTSLKEKLLARENGVESFEEPPINAIILVKEEFQNTTTPNDVSEKGFNEPVVTFKQEDASSAKSDVFDSDSPRSFLEPADSSNVFEPDQSDFSQDEDDELCRSFLPPPCFTKLYHDPPANSCNFEFPIEDQSFWSWNY